MCFGGGNNNPAPAPVQQTAADATSAAAENAARRRALGLGDVTGTIVSTTTPAKNLGGTGMNSTSLGSGSALA